MNKLKKRLKDAWNSPKTFKIMGRFGLIWVILGAVDFAPHLLNMIAILVGGLLYMLAANLED